MCDLRSINSISRDTDKLASTETAWVEAVVDLGKMTTVIRRSWSKVARARLLGTAGDGCGMEQLVGLSAPKAPGVSAPEVATGFANVTLCSIIAGVVERLGDLEAVQQALVDLQRMQTERGCRILDIAAGRIALRAVLQQVLGVQYTAEIDAAWMQLYDLIAAALEVSPRHSQDDKPAYSAA